MVEINESNYDNKHMSDQEILDEAITLISSLTDPKAKVSGRHHVARKILPRLRNLKTEEHICNDICKYIATSDDFSYMDPLEIIGDYARVNGLYVDINRWNYM